MNPMTAMGAPAAGGPGGMDIMALLQMLQNPMQSAMAGGQQPMSPEEAALAQIVTKGGQIPPTVEQTPDLMMLLQLLAQSGMGGGMGGGMPMGGGMTGAPMGGPPMAPPMGGMGY